MKNMKKLANNIEETAKIAGEFIEAVLEKGVGLEKALVLGLHGDLGAGKTAFTKAVAKYLGVKDKVDSPTFILMKKYSLKGQKHKYLHHLDAYRFDKEKELIDLGWEEIVNDKDNLVLIEWPDKVRGVMPAESFKIKITHHGDDSRIFELE